ncbi:uncharacterized protein [Littorina saxatilis]
MDLNIAKGECLVIFFLVSIICGTVPLYLVKKCNLKLHDSKRGKTILCYLNCFAGGVFLGTCLLNLLVKGKQEFAEYREAVDFHYPFPFFEVGIGVGFFLVAMIEKLAYRLHGGEGGEGGGGRGGETVFEVEVKFPGSGPCRQDSKDVGSREAAFCSLDAEKVEGREIILGASIGDGDGDGVRSSNKLEKSPGKCTHVEKDHDRSEMKVEIHSTEEPGQRAAATVKSDSSVSKLITQPSGNGNGIDSHVNVLEDEEHPQPADERKNKENKDRQCSTTEPLRPNEILNDMNKPKETEADNGDTLRSSTIKQPANNMICSESTQSVNGKSPTSDHGLSGPNPDSDATMHVHHDGEEEHGTLPNMSTVRVTLLLLAMSFHTIFDGLAVGLQKHTHALWSVLTAIVIHKAIVSTCLGIELASVMQHRPLRAVVSMLLFAIMAPIGVGIGMGVTSGGVDVRAQLLAGSVLQAIATGAFLYVTNMEILGQSMASHDGSVLKVLTAVAGFCAMSGLKVWEDD